MKVRPGLIPFSWLYGIGVGIRNKFFDWNILKSEAFDVPVISVGNITVGGTGKTPFTEYLIRLLKDEQKVAVLSRGYKRKTHGYLLADTSSTARDIGDEPRQMKAKYPDIHLAVDAKRRRGIHRLCEDKASADTDVVLLDDAYQHRHVTPGVNILLMDYGRMPYEDYMLPAGRLREPFSHRSRAQVIVVTKCPEDIRPIDFRVTLNHLALRPYQRLFFTTCRYGDLRPFDAANTVRPLDSLDAGSSVLLVTGIANPQPIIDKLKLHTVQVSTLSFPDHHTFRTRDFKTIGEAFGTLKGNDRILITTEKDAARLEDDSRLTDDIRAHTYVLPVETVFLRDQAEMFNEYIISYVRKNSRNSIVHKGTNAHHS